jgi:uncharacterized membrane protein YedE/YeeE
LRSIGRGASHETARGKGSSAVTVLENVLPRAERLPSQWPVVASGAIILASSLYFIGADAPRLAFVMMIGWALGLTLYHASFGFTAAFRRLIVYRETSGVRAQIVMLALASALFAPVLAEGQIFGQPVAGAVAPIGVAVAVGSFLFGLGMQLGGACGSGCLFALGGGNARMLVTLAMFCLGAFWATLDGAFWRELPMWESFSFGQSLGFGWALLIQFGLLALLWLALKWWQGDRPQRSVSIAGAPLSWRSLLIGPWPLVFGGIMLAVLNWLVLVVAGHPWSVTWGFTLWGAQAAMALGWDPFTSDFWVGGSQAGALYDSLLRDTVSLLDIGAILGAFTAAGLAGRFNLNWRVPLPSLLAAVIGGLLMGYGARLAFGCNIGAFVSGIASFSLHGWIWLVFGLLGTALGVRLRPLFGLAN